MIRIKSVEAKEDYTLFLTFTDGKRGYFDVKPYLEEGLIFKELKNLGLFNGVRATRGTVEWPNGADLCPDCIYIKTEFVVAA